MLGNKTKLFSDLYLDHRFLDTLAKSSFPCMTLYIDLYSRRSFTI